MPRGRAVCAILSARKKVVEEVDAHGLRLLDPVILSAAKDLLFHSKTSRFFVASLLRMTQRRMRLQ